MKFVVIVILLVSVYAAVKCVNPNTKIWGVRRYPDHRLCFKILKNNRSYFSNFGISEEEVFFPNKNSINTQNITMIKTTDQYSDGTGTKILLTSGGPGYTFFSLQIESKRFKGYNIIVEVFGR